MQVSTRKKLKIFCSSRTWQNHFLVSDVETEDHKCLSTTLAVPMIDGAPSSFNLKLFGTSLAVQPLRLCTSTAGRTGSIPGLGTKIPHAVRCGKINFL